MLTTECTWLMLYHRIQRCRLVITTIRNAWATYYKRQTYTGTGWGYLGHDLKVQMYEDNIKVNTRGRYVGLSVRVSILLLDECKLKLKLVWWGGTKHSFLDASSLRRLECLFPDAITGIIRVDRCQAGRHHASSETMDGPKVSDMTCQCPTWHLLPQVCMLFPKPWPSLFTPCSCHWSHWKYKIRPQAVWPFIWSVSTWHRQGTFAFDLQVWFIKPTPISWSFRRVVRHNNISPPAAIHSSRHHHWYKSCLTFYQILGT